MPSGSIQVFIRIVSNIIFTVKSTLPAVLKIAPFPYPQYSLFVFTDLIFSLALTDI